MYETLVVNKEISRLIAQEADLGQVAEAAAKSGFVDIFDVAARKVKMGITTTEEVIRVLGQTLSQGLRM